MDKLMEMICNTTQLAETVTSCCLEEFARCLYALMSEQWINVLGKLYSHPALWCRLQVYSPGSISCFDSTR